MGYDAAGMGVTPAGDRARSQSGGYDTAGMGGAPAGDRARSQAGGYDEVGTFTKPEQIGKPPATSTKKINNPETAETVAEEKPGELYKYPLSNNYFAAMTFRVKTVNPWEVDLAKAQEIFSDNLIWDVVKGLKEEAQANKQKNLNDAEDAQSAAGAAAKSYQDDYGIGAEGEFSSNAAAGSQAASERKAARDKQEAEATKGVLGMSTSYVKNADAVTLYMPQAINVNDVVNYDTSAELGPAAAAGFAALNNLGSLGAAAMETLRQGFAPLTDLFNANLAGQAARLAASRGASAFLPKGLANAAQLGLQVKVNPHQRTLFTGVNIREFTFQYDFVATSPAEANQVKKIIKFFRTELYPSSFGRDATAVPLGYKFPHLFEIKFRWGDSLMDIPQPILCHLRNVQVVYNPGSMSFHADGQATHIQMTLNFAEFRALTREDIEKGH